jgi:hypothetical protein
VRLWRRSVAISNAKAMIWVGNDSRDHYRE